MYFFSIGAQGQALLAEQGVAAVARSVGPDLAGLGVMHDGLAADVRLARPRYVLLARSQRRADRMHARNEEAVGQRVEHLLTHAGHDSHVDNHVRRIGQLNTDVRNGRADRSHAERNDVHRTALHTSLEEAG